jgi:hypothetical protein
MTRITDRDYRHGEKPFEMRLVLSCAGDACTRSLAPDEALEALVQETT